MGYNKFIKSGNTLEIFTYERSPQIYEGPRRRHSRRNGLSGVADGRSDPLPRRRHSRRNGLSGVADGRSDPLSHQEYEGKRKDNASRASMAFRRLILSNLGGTELPVLLTCTYAENQTDIKQGYKDFCSFIQALRHKFGKVFRYIAVPEFQRRGAVHFHALFWGLPQAAIETERHTRLVAGMWGHGFVYMKETDGNDRLSSYLAKYMAKSFIDYRLKNQKAYTCSRNLLRPQIVGGMNNFTLDAVVEEMGVTGQPKVDKTYDTHWLGKAHYRVYNLEENDKNLSS